jgi:hypothetical protein
MALNTKKYLITTEKREVCIIRNGQHNLLNSFCDECGAITEMLNLDIATTQTGIRTREIFRLIEIGEIHSIETEKGLLIICKNSLFGG